MHFQHFWRRIWKLKCTNKLGLVTSIKLFAIRINLSNDEQFVDKAVVFHKNSLPLAVSSVCFILSCPALGIDPFSRMLAWDQSALLKHPSFSQSFLHKPIMKSNREIFILLLNLIDFSEDLSVSVSAISSLSAYCDSPRFIEHMDTLLIDFYDEMSTAMRAFINRLASENDIQDDFDTTDNLLTFDIEELSRSNELSHLVRLLILEFLQSNLAKPFFNFSHVLLGYDSFFAHTHLGSSSCLDALFDIFEYTVLFESGKLYILHPSFSYKFWDILNLLLEDDRLFEPVLDVLLRKRSNFLVTHLAFLMTNLNMQNMFARIFKLLLRTSTLLLFRCSYTELSTSLTQELTSSFITSLYAIFRMYRCGDIVEELHEDLFDLLFFMFKKFDITPYLSASVLELECSLLDFFIEFPAISDQRALFRLLFQVSTLNIPYENDQMRSTLQGKIRACCDHNSEKATEEFQNYVRNRSVASPTLHCTQNDSGLSFSQYQAPYSWR